jgi:hypothetical protein
VITIMSPDPRMPDHAACRINGDDPVNFSES